MQVRGRPLAGVVRLGDGGDAHTLETTVDIVPAFFQSASEEAVLSRTQFGKWRREDRDGQAPAEEEACLPTKEVEVRMGRAGGGRWRGEEEMDGTWSWEIEMPTGREQKRRASGWKADEMGGFCVLRQPPPTSP